MKNTGKIDFDLGLVLTQINKTIFNDPKKSFLLKGSEQVCEYIAVIPIGITVKEALFNTPYNIRELRDSALSTVDCLFKLKGDPPAGGPD
jgi:hypothetical protein